MGRRVFVPLTDEILYDHPELIDGRVLPYAAGRPCYHWLSVELNPKQDVPCRALQRSSSFSQLLTPFGLPTLDKASRGDAPSPPRP